MINSDSVWNATQSSTVSNSMPLGSMMAMIVLIVGLSGLFMVIWYAGSTLPRYKRLWEVLNRLATVIVCAVIGAIVLGIVWFAYIVLSELFKAVGAFDPIWILYAIGGFALCATVGAATLLLLGKVGENAEAAKSEKTPVVTEVKYD